MSERRCPGCMKITANQVCEHCGWPVDGNNELHQLPVGTVLAGKYLVGRVLGQGGFGITYLGWDMNLDIQVAIKEFYPSSTVNRDNSRSSTVICNTAGMETSFASARERFLREARSLARFRGVPQIVSLFDFFEMNNTAYMVMEFIKGFDLHKYVREKRGKLTMDETMRLLRPVMEALCIVHEAGMIHRDISPDNIMLHPLEGPKLLDFGAVRSVEVSDGQRALTQTNEAILKNGFAPIEQHWSKGDLGPWTDVYALCATFYFCLTGRIPDNAPMRMMEEAALDWKGAEGLTDYQRAVLEHGLALQPKDRIHSMRELMAALFGEAVPERGPQPQPVPPVWEQPPQKDPLLKKKPKLWLIILASVLAVLVLAAAILVPIALRDGGGNRREETEEREEEEAEEGAEEEEEEETEDTTPVMEEPVTEAAPAPAMPWEDNVLMEDPLSSLGIDKSTIRSVTFLDSITDAPKNAFDVSVRQNSRVLAWYDGENVFIAAEAGINGSLACTALFMDCTALETVTFGDAFHTDYAVSMENMFRHCIKLTSVDAQNLETGNVTNMSGMFFGWWDRDGDGYWNATEVSVLTDLDVSGWDVSNVTDMSYMFRYCYSLTTLDVGSWDVSRVVTMQDMFACSEKLEYLDVSRWDVSNVTNMDHLFCDCRALGTVDVSNWDVSGVTDMSYMFYLCSSMEELDLKGWDISRVEEYESFMSDGETINGAPWEEFFAK